MTSLLRDGVDNRNDDRNDDRDARHIGPQKNGTDVPVRVVAYTKRDDRFRLISARIAAPNERRYYYESNT